MENRKTETNLISEIIGDTMERYKTRNQDTLGYATMKKKVYVILYLKCLKSQVTLKLLGQHNQTRVFFLHSLWSKKENYIAKKETKRTDNAG